MKSKLGRLLLAVVALALVAVPTVSFARASGPELSVPKSRLASSVTCSKVAHPKHQPVLLVPGYGTTAKLDFGRNLVKALRTGGYQTCTIAAPGRMLGDIQVSAEYIANAVRTISARTGGGKVDIIGHSEGAASSRWAIKWWPDVRAKVDDLVTIAGANHGAPIGTTLCAARSCTPAAWQLRSGSKFTAALNAGDQTPGHVDVTSIYTATDELIQPFTLSRIKGAKNISIQSVCPGRVALHGEIAFDAVNYALVTDALSHPGTAKPSRVSRLTCLKLFAPGIGAGDYASFMTKDALDFAQGTLGHGTVGQEPALKAYARR
jgi:triacylglycerol lipase